MEEAILGLPKQFSWESVVENAGALKKTDKFVVAGMGGSHLAAGLMKLVDPKLDLLVHRDYGLPRVPDYFLQDSLFIASSYSGNTEETIDAFKMAHEAGLACAVITTGGVLLDLAKSTGVPYIQIPSTGIQPRMALGSFCRALAKLTGQEGVYAELGGLTGTLEAQNWQGKGQELATKLSHYPVLIYASTANLALAYNWKIKFNETGKTPAFYNVFPELNHNEMTGVHKLFGVVMLHDESDDHRVHKRMDITADLYNDKGIKVEVIKVEGATKWQKIFNSLLLADWTAFYLATQAGAEPEQVPMIEQFKKLMAE